MVLRFCNRTDRLWQVAKLAAPPPFGLEDRRRREFLQSLKSSGILDDSRPGEDAAWKLDTGVVTQRQLYRAFLQAAGCNEDAFPPERFWMAYSSDLVVIPPVCDLLSEVQQRTVVIAATNGETWSADLVYRQTGFQFDGAVMSWQVGHKKPDHEFFEACLAKARAVQGDRTLNYPDCVFIDDIQAYCDGFEKLGGHAIQFEANPCPLTLALQMNKLRLQLAELRLP
ncbi:MAG: hypothetical protein Q7S23_05350 [bacterium]|nr:hypothetical protein [bacterium]